MGTDRYAVSRSVRRHVFDFIDPALILLRLNDTTAIVLMFGIVGLIDVLWMLWDENRQTLHDKFGGTYVVRA